ncbi:MULTISPECIES: discoidin domain-containing protein [Streptomyces]|uniref:discoidin domain-containing protein n=1 Tax=Streptomyces TaxID=1883 RepID=UPI0034269510
MVFHTAVANAAVQETLYVSPSGSGTACSSSSPCAIAQAKTNVRALTSGMTGDIVVNLSGGTYDLSAPLSFGKDDSGKNGFNVRWQAASGAHVVLSGAKTVTGWTESDSTKHIWKAQVASGVNTRQIYVNGQRATLARGGYHPQGFTQTATGYTTTTAASMAGWKNPSQIEFSYHARWTYSRCPVASVSGTAVTMAQPCWKNQTNLPFLNDVTPYWVENAYELLDDSGEWYLDRTGTVDGSQKETLYYKPKPGESMTGSNAVTVTYPAVQQLLNVAGSDAANEVHNLQFVGLTFADSTWTTPFVPAANGDVDGFVEQQANFTITGLLGSQYRYSDYTQTPAAVDITYAHHILFQGNTITRVGDAGLNVGHSSHDVTILGNKIYDVSASGVQVGGISKQDQRPSSATVIDDAASGITYNGSSWAAQQGISDQHSGTQYAATANGDSFSYTFTGTGIDFISTMASNRGKFTYQIDSGTKQEGTCHGGSTAKPQNCASIRGLSNASHTLTVTKTDGDYLSLDALKYYGDDASVYAITVQDNYIHNIAEEFQGGVPIFGGFVNGLDIAHNEVSDIPYSGISVGWGWTYLDNGGIGDGTGSATGPGTKSTTVQLTTPTVAGNNRIRNNYVHHYELAGHDGGASYTLGSQPNSVQENNYYADAPEAAPGSVAAIAHDNGTQGYTDKNNVLHRSIQWLAINEDPSAASRNNTVTGNWSNANGAPCQQGLVNDVCDSTNNTTIVGDAWPSAAQDVIKAAGLETDVTDSLGVPHNWATELHGPDSTTDLALKATASSSSNYNSSTLVDDNSSAVTYAGSWVEQPYTGLYGGKQRVTTANNDSFTYTFTGFGIDFISTMATNRGSFTYTIDGKQELSGTCYAATEANQKACASIRGLAYGSHTIKVTKTGGQYLTLDALNVIGHDASNAIDANSQTRWAAANSDTMPTLTLTFDQAITTNRIVLREAQQYGGAIQTYKIESWDGSAWKEIATDAYPGVVRTLRFPAETTTKLKLTVTTRSSTPTVQGFEVYND